MEVLLFFIGGNIYMLIEILWRGYTHWTMFLLGGLCFVIMGLLNEHIFLWELSLVEQSVISAVIITIFEFCTGCICNLCLGWEIWDYSGLPLNLCGQICLLFSVLWIPLSVVGIVLDDWIRYGIYLWLHKWFPKMQTRERPHYQIVKVNDK